MTMNPTDMASQETKGDSTKICAPLYQATSVHEGTMVQQNIETKVYKRRFIGIVVVFALNVSASLAWVDMSSVVDLASKHFGTSVSSINWFSTSFLFMSVASNWPASIAARRSVKLSMMICSGLMIIGTWVMYGGTHTKSFGLALFGHCVIALSQPFVLILPAPYSELWFEPTSRTTATSVASIANVLGGTVGQFIMTAWVKTEADVTRGILYQSILLTVVACMVVFVPSKPPTPPGLATTHERTVPYRQELPKLFGRPEFYMLGFPFAMLSAIVNAMSFLIFQMCMPYGFTVDQCVIAGCLLIVPGLLTSLIVARAADIYKCHKGVMKSLIVIMGAGFLAFVWVPPSRSIAFLYSVVVVISIGTVGPLAVSVELAVEVLYPLRPELAIALMWATGQLLGGVLTIVVGLMTDKYGGLQPGVYLQTALALCCLPFTLSLGLWGRHHHVQLARTHAEEEATQHLESSNQGGKPTTTSEAVV